LQLDDPINKYLPLKLVNPRYTADAAVSMKDFFQNVLLEEGEWFRSPAFLDKKPGSTFEYSNVGAALAAFVDPHWPAAHPQYQFQQQGGQ